LSEINRSDMTSKALVVDGVAVPKLATPERVEDVADILRTASERDEVVIPLGGGTLLGFGNIPEAADVALDLTRLNQIVVYEPDDMTIAAQAGCRIDELNAILAEHGQMLPFEVACPAEATLGGLYAAGISGPRRFGHGSMRDLVIGITSVSPSGEITRGGGMVVKNVSGYDMMRLHYGALGSLGVVLQLNFKVLPRPRAQRTVVMRYAGMAEAVDAALTVRDSQLAPTAVVLLDSGGSRVAELDDVPWTLLMRAEGPSEAAAQQTKRLRDAAEIGAIDGLVLEDEATEALWAAANVSLSAAPETNGIVVRIGLPPSQAFEIVEDVLRVAREYTDHRALSVDFGNGLLFVRLESEGEHVAELRLLWEALREIGTHATLLTAPPSAKQGIDVYGAEPAGFGLMRALKQQFDPKRTLNRGRFIGRL
jgi:glycolate oxidase FAD binding subunit